MNYKQIIESHKDFPIEGIEYLDLNPIYKDPKVRDELVHDCLGKIVDMIPPTFDYIGVVESRGFLVGSIIAHLLDKGLLLLRSKPGRLPGDTEKISHTLEYGESQMEVQVGRGSVLIFDDVLATGGTAQAAIDVLTMAGYNPVGALFPVELTFLNPKCCGEPKISVPYRSVVKY